MTTRPLIDRRRFLASAIAVPLVGAASGAQAQAASAFRGLAVDVTPLDRFGGGGAYRFLAPALLAQMNKVFADRLAPGDRQAPLLTARITAIYMAAYDGRQTFDAFGGNDSIEGDGVVSAGRQVLSTTHILTELPPSYSGALVTENLDGIRYQSIAYQFAYWLRREMGL